jgi:hypothetical protein
MPAPKPKSVDTEKLSKKTVSAILTLRKTFLQCQKQEWLTGQSVEEMSEHITALDVLSESIPGEVATRPDGLSDYLD